MFDSVIFRDSVPVELLVPDTERKREQPGMSGDEGRAGEGSKRARGRVIG